MEVLILAVLLTTVLGDSGIHFIVPKEFMFGAATSAYQSEGSWDVDGKEPSIWDTYAHKYSHLIADHSNADQSAESYCRYKDDVEALRDMGMQFYRFSISWSRVLPTGFTNKINEKGIGFYNGLINELLAYNITPIVTMYHWDLPQSLQDLGGWTNELLVDYFEDYARILFKNFGDRVKWWITFNEPRESTFGYEGEAGIRKYAPYVNGTGFAPYLAGHTMLKAHARVYHMYADEFRSKQKGKLSISVDVPDFEPENESSPGHNQAAERAVEFFNNWFLHPIFSKTGDYPDIMKKRIGNFSKESGFSESRLPSFTPEEVQFIKGTADYAALNHYGIILVNDKEQGPNPSTMRDAGASIPLPTNSSNTTSLMAQNTPKGIRKAINRFRRDYGGWDIIISESGYGDSGGLNDSARMNFLGVTMAEILKLIHEDGIKVMGYVVWSLIDVMEFNHGYALKFGLYQVDFNDPSRGRTPRHSARLMKNIISERRLPYRYIEEDLKLMNPYRIPNYAAGLPAENKTDYIDKCAPRIPPPKPYVPFLVQVLKGVSDFFTMIGNIKKFFRKLLHLQ